MRYLPLTTTDREAMLETIGINHIDALFSDVPSSALHNTKESPIHLPPHQSEIEVERFFEICAQKNLYAGQVPFFIGGGLYYHHVPASVDALIQRGEFLTSYTPYQPEISQGTLQALFEFQTFICLLTGMEVANASMYDGATAAAEAVQMANRIIKRKKALISGGLHPHYIQTIKTHSIYNGFEIETLTPDFSGQEYLADKITDDLSCVIVQTPDFFGHLHDYNQLAEMCHNHGCLLIIAVNEIISLGALKAPGDMGADIVIGEGQSIGNNLNFGGPSVGFFATKQQYLRQMPGRLCGETTDLDGKRGFVLTLSTREQHIKREKATSNICTNSGLCSLAFTIHLALLGEKGLYDLATLNHQKALETYHALREIEGITCLNTHFFNEFTISLKGKSAKHLVDKLAEKRLLAGIPLSRLYPHQEEAYDKLLIATTEMSTTEDIQQLASCIKEAIK